MENNLTFIALDQYQWIRFSLEATAQWSVYIFFRLFIYFFQLCPNEEKKKPGQWAI